MDIDNNSIIPVDDIESVYAEADTDTKLAITNILTSAQRYISATYAGTLPNDMPLVSIGWRADDRFSILLVGTLIRMGTKQYGDAWLNSLIAQLPR